ncbi:DpnD/PcfM family protein [uncultured Psychrobacter sp.]|uniref:DpnD/PcfM family protein n=1 Tax=uncultured Psychrobacter sp. TaxID=259303 RepID=UPI0030D8DAD9
MAKFSVMFTETLNTVVEYEADSEEEALEMGRDDYNDGKITLTSEDFSGHYEIELTGTDDESEGEI